jgi:hypothetical protein
MSPTSIAGSASVSSEVSMAVARKSLDAQKEQGAAMVALLDSAGRIAAANAEVARGGSSAVGKVDRYA